MNAVIAMLAILIGWSLVAGRLERWNVTPALAMIIAGIVLTAGSEPFVEVDVDNVISERVVEITLAVDPLHRRHRKPRRRPRARAPADGAAARHRVAAELPARVPERPRAAARRRRVGHRPRGRRRDPDRPLAGRGHRPRSPPAGAPARVAQRRIGTERRSRGPGLRVLPRRRRLPRGARVGGRGAAQRRARGARGPRRRRRAGHRGRSRARVGARARMDAAGGAAAGRARTAADGVHARARARRQRLRRRLRLRRRVRFIGTRVPARRAAADGGRGHTHVARRVVRLRSGRRPGTARRDPARDRRLRPARPDGRPRRPGRAVARGHRRQPPRCRRGRMAGLARPGLDRLRHARVHRAAGAGQRRGRRGDGRHRPRQRRAARLQRRADRRRLRARESWSLGPAGAGVTGARPARTPRTRPRSPGRGRRWSGSRAIRGAPDEVSRRSPRGARLRPRPPRRRAT